MYSIKTIINQQVNSHFGIVTKYKIVNQGVFFVTNEVYYELDIKGVRYIVIIPTSINTRPRCLTVADYMKGANND